MDNRQLTIHRYRITDQVYNILQSWILNGSLVPGEEISIDSLAKKLKISITPIREALNKLKGKGLVVDAENTKIKVIELSPQELAQIFDLRTALETFALRCGFENLSEKGLHQELETLQRAEKDLEKGDSESFHKADRILHDLIVTSAKNKWLTEVMSQLKNLIEITKNMCVSLERYKASIPEHISIVESILKGDKKTAVRSLEDHLNNAKQRLLISLEKKRVGN